MSESEDPVSDPDLSDLVQVVKSRFRIVVATALACMGLALGWSLVRKPIYEASAYLEIEEPSEIPTIEGRLGFFSLYRGLTDSDDAARDLQRRTRTRNPRGSRLVSVTVRQGEPEGAANEANAVASGYIQAQIEPLVRTASDLESQLAVTLRHADEAPSANSLHNLGVTWQSVSREYSTLLERYDDQEDHPSVVGARERRDAVARRLREQLETIATGMEMQPVGDDLADQLDLITRRLKEIRSNIPVFQERIRQLRSDAARLEIGSEGVPVRLVEAAPVPVRPAGLGLAFVGIGGLAMGAFVGILLALSGCCQGCCSPKATTDDTPS